MITLSELTGLLGWASVPASEGAWTRDMHEIVLEAAFQRGDRVGLMVGSQPEFTDVLQGAIGRAVAG